MPIKLKNLKVVSNNGAVSCGCCSCTGMFKQLGVDIQVPSYSWTIAPIVNEGVGNPNAAVHFYLEGLPSNAGVSGSYSLLSMGVFLIGATDQLLIRVFNPPCNTGPSAFYSDCYNLAITSPTRLFVSGRLGYCMNEEWERVYTLTITGYIPTWRNCSEGLELDWDSNLTANSQSSEIVNWEVVNGYLAGNNSENSVSFEGHTTYSFNFFTGLALKRLSDNAVFNANPYTGEGGSPNITTSPAEGRQFFATFPGFDRTIPGGYELTWPLLKAPYNFTIPAPPTPPAP